MPDESTFTTPTTTTNSNGEGIAATQQIYRWKRESGGLHEQAARDSFPTPRGGGGTEGFGGYSYAPPGSPNLGAGHNLNAVFGQQPMGDQQLPTGPLASGRDAQFEGDIIAADMGPTIPNGSDNDPKDFSYGPVGGANPYDDGTMLGNIGAHMIAKNQTLDTGAGSGHETGVAFGGTHPNAYTNGIKATLTHTSSGADIIRSLQNTSVAGGQAEASGKAQPGYSFGHEYGWFGNVQGGFERIRDALTAVDMVGVRHVPGMKIADA